VYAVFLPRSSPRFSLFFPRARASPFSYTRKLYLRLYVHALSGGQCTFFGRRAADFTRRSTKNILFRASTVPCSLNPNAFAASVNDSMEATPLDPSKRLRTSAIQHTPPTFKTWKKETFFGKKKKKSLVRMGERRSARNRSCANDPSFGS